MLALAFVAFLLIGLPEGVLGTAWPEIRDSLGRPTSDLGIVIVAYTAGYLASTTLSGHLFETIGLGRALATGASVGAVGAVTFAISGGWAGLLAGAALMAVGNGLADSGLNSYLALHHGPRAMNLAHGVFGVGATLGPLIIVATLQGGAPWEAVYVSIAGFFGVVAVMYLIHRPVADIASPPVVSDSARAGNARGFVLAILTVFFFYIGIEVSVGAWSFTLLTEGRGVSATTAGIAVSAFWGGLTLSRLGLGWIGSRIDPHQTVRWSVVATAATIVLLWVDPFAGADIIALPLGGFAMAGIFPSLVLLTPRWVGSSQTGRIVGYQMAASSAGAIAAAIFTRQLVDARGPNAIGVALGIATLGLLASFAILDRTAPR